MVFQLVVLSCVEGATGSLRLSLTCAKAQFYKPWPIIGHRASDLRLSLTRIDTFRCSVL